MNNENIGKKIAKLRNKRKMTQLELSELLHVSDKTISKWEQGNSQVSYEFLEEIAKVFNVKIDYFYKDINLDKTFKNFMLKLFNFIKRNWLTIILSLTTIFFGFYYFNTIDSLEMYEIVDIDVNDNINFDNGYFIKSKTKMIIYISNIKYDNEDKNIVCQKIKLYTMKNNDKVYFYVSEEMNDIVYKDFIDYTLDKKLVKNLDKNLYLEIENLYDDKTVKTEEIKLTLNKAITTNAIFYQDKLNVENKSESAKPNEINDYLLLFNDYTKVGDSKIYTKDYQDYQLYFDLDSKAFTKNITNQKENIKVIYYYDKDEISYNKKQNNKEIDKYVYYSNDNRLDCYQGSCQDYLKVYKDAKAFYNKVISEFSKS